LSHGAQCHESIGPEILLWHNLAHRLYYVPPHPGQIVVLLVEGDPGERQAGFFCLTPLDQERRLPVPSRGGYEANLAVRGFPEELEQSGADQLLGARRRRVQFGLDDDTGRVDVSIV